MNSPTPYRPPTADRLRWFAHGHEALVANAEQVIRGKRDVLALAVTCLVAEGHLLIEDVPGVGKTSIARALAGSIGATWHRVQFTPDLLPSDLTGVAIWNQDAHAFEFRPGPVFANIVVGDEINRASPKTQSALLEVMQERQVTFDAVTHPLPRPFIVIATQNPIDLEGTYRLPEAQLDRFLMRITVGYPAPAAEVEVLQAREHLTTQVEVQPVIRLDDVRHMIDLAAGVHVADAMHRYIVAVAGATRELPGVRLGVSPRGSLALLRAAQVRAASEGRAFVLPEDVKALAEAVFAHRLVLTPESEFAGRRPQELVATALASVAVPDLASVR
ncbi:MAG TPA: MoxR family ATPase [Acidimicrobiales bacterium]